MHHQCYTRSQLLMIITPVSMYLYYYPDVLINYGQQCSLLFKLIVKAQLQLSNKTLVVLCLKCSLMISGMVITQFRKVS